MKTGYYIELLKPETMKLLRNTKSKITTNENGENVPHLEITEVLLLHCIFVMMIISKTQEACIHLFLINNLVKY